MSDTTTAGLTVADVAARLRVSPDKVRAWIDAGELRAINTAARLCGRRRLVISPSALEEFEQRRRGGPTPQPKRQRRPKHGQRDYYPD